MKKSWKRGLTQVSAANYDKQMEAAVAFKFPPPSTSPGIASVLLSTATSAKTTRTAICGRGFAVSASQHAVRTSIVAVASMGEQGKDRGFTAEKRQDTGVGLSEVVKTGG